MGSSEFSDVYAVCYGVCVCAAWAWLRSHVNFFSKKISNQQTKFVSNCFLKIFVHKKNRTVHAWFMEIPNVRNLAKGALVAYFHHYHNYKALSDHWLEHRLGFLPGPLENNGAPTYIAVFLLYKAYGWYVFGIMVYTAILVTLLAAVHEWFHLKQSERRAHHNWLTNKAYYFMEYLSIINSKEHSRHHHSHGRNQCDDVEDFFVSITFGMGWVYNKIWQWSLKFHPGDMPVETEKGEFQGEGKMVRTKGFGNFFNKFFFVACF